jgi:hypothetical protein
MLNYRFAYLIYACFYKGNRGTRNIDKVGFHCNFISRASDLPNCLKQSFSEVSRTAATADSATRLYCVHVKRRLRSEEI